MHLVCEMAASDVT